MKIYVVETREPMPWVQLLYLVACWVAAQVHEAGAVEASLAVAGAEVALAVVVPRGAGKLSIYQRG